jgi:hypothetical protein
MQACSPAMVQAFCGAGVSPAGLRAAKVAKTAGKMPAPQRAAPQT